MKYILVTGGVISGIGKGVIASSLGVILKCCGLRVTSIKIDPYINIDAGTFSPYEHGEVFVLDDGGEVDLDLGNYERFLDVTLHRDNNITTGKIYQHVISKERQGGYLGKTVQVVPHVTDAIQEWVERVAYQPVGDGSNTTAASNEPEVCIIELGGTIGDIEGMQFVEAFRQFQFRVKTDNFCNVHVSLVPEVNEHKTKPTQDSVRKLMGMGLLPSLIFCRSQNPINQQVKEKISNFCHVAPEQVICIHNCSSLYMVPVMLEEQGVLEFLRQRLQLDVAQPLPKRLTAKWKDMAERYDRLRKEVNIVLVGKYTKLEDSYASVVKSLNHAALAIDHKLVLKWVEAADLEERCKEEQPVKYHEAWQLLCSASGVIAPGGFGNRGMEGKIAASEWCRKMKIPFLGICLGLQAAVIGYARTVLGWTDAHSTEMDPNTCHPVVIDMPEHNTGQMGGTMRLGKRVSIFKPGNSILRLLYGNVESIEERHRHRYEVDPKVVPELEAAGMKFVATDVDGQRMEMIELDPAEHPYFVATQFHPEYMTRPLKPSPPYLGLMLASVGKLNSYLARGCKPSPRELSDFSDDDDADDVDLATLLRQQLVTSDKKRGDSSGSNSSNDTKTQPQTTQQQQQQQQRKNLALAPPTSSTSSCSGTMATLTSIASPSAAVCANAVAAATAATTGDAPATDAKGKESTNAGSDGEK